MFDYKRISPLFFSRTPDLNVLGEIDKKTEGRCSVIFLWDVLVLKFRIGRHGRFAAIDGILQCIISWYSTFIRNIYDTCLSNISRNHIHILASKPIFIHDFSKSARVASLMVTSPELLRPWGAGKLCEAAQVWLSDGRPLVPPLQGPPGDTFQESVAETLGRNFTKRPQGH